MVDFPPQSGQTFAGDSFASAFFSGSGGADPATSVVLQHAEIEETMWETQRLTRPGKLMVNICLIYG